MKMASSFLLKLCIVITFDKDHLLIDKLAIKFD